MTDAERIDFMKKALTAQQTDNWEEAKMQARLRDTYRSRMEAWRHLVYLTCFSPNPWARMWKYVAKYWRNSYRMEKRSREDMTRLYLETREGIASKLERVAERQGPGGLCQTEHEREILKMLAGEIRGGRWK